MTRPAASLQVRRLQKRMESLGIDVRRGERAWLATWRPRLVGSAYAGSAANLAAYLSFRQHDVREIQDELAVLRLSSLGRTESHVRSGIAAVEAALGTFLGDSTSLAWVARIGRLREAQARLVAERAAVLLGPQRPARQTRIMVTLPEAAADDAGVVRDLVERGMDIARINAAHDGPDTWRAMALLVRAASRDAGRDCRILLDLPGPKMRIGPLPSAPGRLRLRSSSEDGGRNVFRSTAPVRRARPILPMECKPVSRSTPRGSRGSRSVTASLV